MAICRFASRCGIARARFSINAPARCFAAKQAEPTLRPPRRARQMSSTTEPLSRARLNHAAHILGEVLHFAHPADGLLSRYFRENRSLGHRDRAWVAEVVYTVLRRLR